VARTCPACGRANEDDASFCQGCGSALDAPVSEPAGVAASRSAGVAAAPPTPPPDEGGGTPPRRGTRAPKWLVALIVVVAIALLGSLAYVFIPRGGGTASGQASADQGPSTPTAGATVGVSPSPGLDQYLAGAVGPKADGLAAIMDDGTVKPITRFNGRQISQIAYSPDGKWLACIAGTYRRSELWLFDAATGAALQATVHAPEIIAVDSIAWLSDQRLLVAGFTEPPKATGQNADLLVYDAGSQGFSPLTGTGGVPLRGVSVSASHEGAKIAFVTYTDAKTDKYGMATANERLELLDSATGALKQLGQNKALFDVNARAFDEPLISPTGDAVIYRRAGSDVGTSYTIVAADGSTLMPARETQLPAGYAWDPGGTRVVFTGHSLKPAANSGIGPAIFWVFDTQTETTQVLARYADTMVQDLSWSPDGESIAWAAYDQKKYRTGTIFVMPAAGGDSKALVKGALSPVWAPGATGSLQTSPGQ